MNHNSISAVEKPSRIYAVETQGNEVLIRIQRHHYVVSHRGKGDWRVYAVQQFPHTGSVTKRAYPFVKGPVALANSTSWSDLRTKLLDKNYGFLH